MTIRLVRPGQFFALIVALVTFTSVLRAATLPVYNTNDAFAGSLRQAIQDAAPGDTIVFQIPVNDPGYDYHSNTWTITLTSDSLYLRENLTVDGGGSKIIVRRSPGGSNFRIFTCINPATVTLANLTIRDGVRGFNDSGGGISNSGTLTVRNCTLVNNSAAALGSAIFNFGTLTVLNCTVTGNTSSGAAIENGGDAGNLTIISSTIAGNTGTSQPCGGVTNESGRTARVRNTIIVGNTAGGSPNVEGTFVSEGYNLIGAGFAPGFTATGDQVGVSTAQVNLGSLADNGGLTQTLVPGGGSLAIDQGKRGLDASGQPINIDQRGSPRPVEMPGVNNAIGGDGSDIGAVELGLPQAGPNFTVTSTAGHSNGGCTADDCTLREALNASNANPDANVINFAAGVVGSIPPPTSAGFSITNPVTVNGPGARSILINGGGVNRLFAISNSNVSISGLTIAYGFADTGGGGGGFNVSGGSLTLTDCFVLAHTASGTNGGALYVASGATLTLNRSTLDFNSSTGLGGAIYSQGIVLATNCTFFNNSAFNGGAIFSEFNSGNSRLTLKNCTITLCSASDTASTTGSGGGGIYAFGSNGQYHLGNTIIAGNRSGSNPQMNPDVRGSFTSDGHNFIGNLGNSSLSTTGVTGDQIGTSAAPRNPMLNPSLANNGGPTDTLAPLSGSPAINTGDDALAPSTDQRGYPRIGVSDIGAFEFGSGTLRISSTRRSGNDILIEFTEAVANTTYRLERKSEMTDAMWQPINGQPDLTAGVTGSGQITHSGGASSDKGFYRVRQSP